MKFKAKTKVNIVVETEYESLTPGFDTKNAYKEIIKEQALNALKDYFLGKDLDEKIISLNIKTTIKGED